MTYLSGAPPALTYLSCSSCFLSSLYSFVSTSLSVLNVNNNVLTSLPNFPASMSYIDCSYNQLTSLNLPLTLSYLNCSNNQLTSLPPVLPSGSYILLAGNNNLTFLPSTFPDSMISMSIDNNLSLSVPPIYLPADLEYFSLNNCPVGSLPTFNWPVGITYLSAQSCSLVTMDSIVSSILSNVVTYSPTYDNGYIDLRGNGTPSPPTLANLSTLANAPYNWTVYHD